jgi:DNA-binding NarL/FixJ family response regulator/tetratricopeptide (TPR) repeat protein
MVLRRYSTPFVGRRRDLARLQDCLGAASAGWPQALLIGGEAGVGKTRLVSEFSAQAGDAGVRVLAGGCIDVSGGLPFGPIVEAFRGLERDLGPAAFRELLGPAYAELERFLPTSRGDWPRAAPTGASAQDRLFELVLRLLSDMGAETPVVLVVEDLHWADRSTLDLLMFLVRNLRRERLVLIATYRSDAHPASSLRAFRAEFGRQVDRVELARFDREELASLLAALLGSPPEAEVVDRVMASSDGNPFFAEELVAAGLDNQIGWLSPRLRDVLMARTEALSQEAQETLRVAAVVGRRVEHRLLAAVSELDDRRLLQALREAVAHQLLVTDPEGMYVFRHTLARQAIYEDLIAGERQRLHAAVAAALAADPSRVVPGASSAAELAHHWTEAQDLPRALAATVEAARQSATAVYAFAEADRQYRRALTLWDRVEPERRPADLTHPRLLEEAAEAARWAGDASRAITLVRRALAGLELPAERGRAGLLHERLGLYLWEAGDGQRSLEAYQTADRLLAAEPPSAERARVLAAHGAAFMLTSRYRDSLPRCQEALAMARAVGAREAECHALNTLGFDLVLLGRPEEGIARLEESRRIAVEDANVDGVCRAHTNLATVLPLVGRLQEAAEVAEQGIQVARRLGVELTGAAVLLGVQALLLFRLGQWDPAEAAATALLARELPDGLTLFAHVTLVELGTARGLPDRAERLRAAFAAAREVTDPFTLSHLYATAAGLAIWDQDGPAARSAVGQGLEVLSGTQEEHLVLWLCALGVRAEADQGERLRPARDRAELAAVEATADALLARAEAAASDGEGASASFPEARIALALCHAERRRLARQPEVAGWSSIAARWADLGCPYAEAYARWRQAEAALQARDHAAAGAALRRANALAAGLGAVRLGGEIEHLAARGRLALDQPAAPVPDAVPAGPAERLRLTRREQEVLNHLAKGASNRQIARALFITEKTASVHVSNIIAKLGVGNRGEAAALAYRLNLVDLSVPP